MKTLKLRTIIIPILFFVCHTTSMAQGDPETETTVETIVDTNEIQINSDEMIAGTVASIKGAVHISAVSEQAVVPDAQYITNDTVLLWVQGGGAFEELYLGASDEWWPDYVFEEDYELPSLNEVEEFVKENKHLPYMQSAREMSKNKYYGVEQVTIGQLRSLEELLLHVINQEKKIKAQEAMIIQQTGLLNELEVALKRLSK